MWKQHFTGTLNFPNVSVELVGSELDQRRVLFLVQSVLSFHHTNTFDLLTKIEGNIQVPPYVAADDRFTKMMEENRGRILDSMENAPEVARQLFDRKIISEKELLIIYSKPSRSTQKEMLVNLMKERGRGQEKLQSIITIFRDTNNQGLELLFASMNDELFEQFLLTRESNHLKSEFDQLACNNTDQVTAPTQSKLHRFSAFLMGGKSDDGQMDSDQFSLNSVVTSGAVPIQNPLDHLQNTLKNKIEIERQSSRQSQSQSQDQDPGFLTINDPYATIQSTSSILNQIDTLWCTCSFRKLFRTASEGNSKLLKKLIHSKNVDLELCYGCTSICQGQTLLHAAVLAKNSTDAVKCVDVLLNDELLLKTFCGAAMETDFSGMMKKIGREHCIQTLCNQQDALGQTAIHLAAENERVKVVEHLYFKYKCDILIQNKYGDTALDLVNTYMPSVAWRILSDETLPLAKNDNSLDAHFTLEIDFGRIVGYRQQAQKEVRLLLLNNRKNYAMKTEENADEENTLISIIQPETKNDNEVDDDNDNHGAAENYTEMRTLTKLVHSTMDGSYSILSHVMVKTFLDLKWKKMRPFVYTYMVFKILTYMWYTIFVVHVFLAKCPISSHKNVLLYVTPSAGIGSHALVLGNESIITDAVETTTTKNVLTYLFGGYESAAEALTGVYNKPQLYEPLCNFEYDSQALIFLGFGILFTIKEICEAIRLNSVKLSKHRCGLVAYWNSWENRFQLLFNVLMILIGTLAFQTSVPNYYYSYAAISIVVVWALIFMQVSYLMGQGMYVQLLGKIIKRFATLMANYMCWIIAFSISLSLLFPQEKPFETLPKSLLRVITMMSGELNYENTFYGQHSQYNTENGKSSNNGSEIQGGQQQQVSSIIFTAQIIYISLALLLTIILSNALIGLVVTDVRELRERSQVLHRSIKVNKMFKMEAALVKLRKLCPWLDAYIFVIQPKNVWEVNGNGKPTGKGMVLKISTKEMNISRKLEEEIREFAMDAKTYKITTCNCCK